MAELKAILSGLAEITAVDIDADRFLMWDASGNVLGTAEARTLFNLIDALVYKGVIDCSANPNYPAADAGHIYKVSVAGKIGGGSGPNVEAGDTLICHVDASTNANHATVGANWGILQTNVDGAVTTSGTQTLTNKRITAREVTEASNATPTPNADTTDIHTITAQAAAAAFAAPSGTPTQGQSMIIRIKDNGTARALSFNAIYRAIGVTLPTTTVISKTMYIGMIYNLTDTKWDVLAVAEEA
jgi:hypothetical protein